MLRTTIMINQTRFFLAQGHDPAKLRTDMVAAVKGGGDFVAFTEVGNRLVNALVSPGVSIIFEEREVAEDERDTGDISEPFDAPEGAQRGYVDYDLNYLS